MTKNCLHKFIAAHRLNLFYKSHIKRAKCIFCKHGYQVGRQVSGTYAGGFMGTSLPCYAGCKSRFATINPFTPLYRRISRKICILQRESFHKSPKFSPSNRKLVYGIYNTTNAFISKLGVVIHSILIILKLFLKRVIKHLNCDIMYLK